MQRVIVTVKRQNEARVRDLEVPAEVEAEQLSKMIAQALRWESDPAGQPVEYEIEAEPPGRALAPQESLAEAGAWDGAWLVFRPLGKEPPLPPPKPAASPTPTGGPVAGWRPLGIDLPSGQAPEQAEVPQPSDASAETGGFVWKPLD